MKFSFKTNKNITKIETENYLAPTKIKGTTNHTLLFFGDVFMALLPLSDYHRIIES